MVNTQGLVIGVNTAIDARAQGIGFVIPIDNVKTILPQLEKEGGVQHSYIGVQMADIDAEGGNMLNLQGTAGTLITAVLPGGPAEKAGVQPYDLVVEFAGKAVKNTRDLFKDVAVTPVGQSVQVKIIRNGKPKALTLRTSAYPEAKAVAGPEEQWLGSRCRSEGAFWHGVYAW